MAVAMLHKVDGIAPPWNRNRRANTMHREQALYASQHQNLLLADFARHPDGVATPDTPVRRARILVVNHDLADRRMLADYLGQHNMSVVTASGTQDVAPLLSTQRFSMVILDRRLGQDNGLDLLKELRSRTTLPIILLTDDQADVTERVVGLELGADDSIARPFAPCELLARMRAVLRRAQAPAEEVLSSARDEPRSRLRFGSWTLNKRTRHLTNAKDSPVSLTRTEYMLLLAFLDAPRRPLTREHLLKATRGHEDVFDRSIDVQVLRLRRKFDIDPHIPSIIQTERGVGYVFTLMVEAI